MRTNEQSRGQSKHGNLIVAAGLTITLLAIAAPAVAQEADTNSQVSKREIVVSIADRKLALMEAGRLLKIYPIAVGKRVTPSPTGEFKVFNRVTYPTYYHEGKVVPPGRANPLGSRWIGLSTKGYGIHGTNAPDSIGHAASHGCIRMRKSDIEELFELVRVGDTVEIKVDSQISEWARASAAPVTLAANSSEPALNSSTQAGARITTLAMASVASE